MKTASPISCLIFGTLLLGAASALSAQTFFSGHADLGLGEGSSLEPHLHLSAGAVIDGQALADEAEYEPDELLIYVSQNTADYIDSIGGRPAGAEWNPLGVAAGESFWFLPGSGAGAGGATALGTPFLGVGGEEIELGAFDNNSISLTLIGASMPEGAVFSAYTFAGFSPSFLMSTADGIDATDTVTLDLDLSDHVHFNWAFTQAGIYDLTFEVSALQGGVPVTAEATYSFGVVVPEPSTASALAGLAVIGLVAVRHRRRA